MAVADDNSFRANERELSLIRRSAGKLAALFGPDFDVEQVLSGIYSYPRRAEATFCEFISSRRAPRRGSADNRRSSPSEPDLPKLVWQNAQIGNWLDFGYQSR